MNSMRRALVVRRILLVVCVAAELFPMIGRGLYGHPLSGDDAGDSRALQWDDATLRRLLRAAVSEAIAVQDTVLDSQRSAAFDMLASAQASVGDAEGARATRELAVKASLSKPADTYNRLKIRAFDLARAGKMREAARAYNDAVRFALDPNHVEPHSRMPADLFFVLSDGRSLADILNRGKDPEAARQVLLHARAAAQNQVRGRVEWAFHPIREQARKGDIAGARASIDAVAPQIDALGDPVRRLEGLKDMAAMRWLLGDKEIARALCKSALEFGRSLPPEVLQVSYPMHLPMQMLATVEDYEGAFRIVKEVPARLRCWAVEQVVQSIGLRAGVDQNHQEAGFDSPIDRETARKALRLAATANQTFQRNQDPFALSGDAYSNAAAIVGLQARIGDIQGARATIEGLATFDDGAKAANARARGLVEIALANSKASRRDEANADFQAALVAADSLPERVEEGRSRHGRRITYPRDEVKSTVVVARAELGDFEQVIEAAGRIHDPARKANALSSA